MSLENYLLSQDISDKPFEAIIMGFMRIADDNNTVFLKMKYPEIWAELQARYNAPGGVLPGELKHCENCGNQYDKQLPNCPRCEYVRKSNIVRESGRAGANIGIIHPGGTYTARLTGTHAPPFGVGEEKP